MTKWDWDRIGSLVDNVDNLIQSARSLHQQGTVADHDTDGLFSFVCSLEREVATIKSLLKRERSKRD